MRLVPVFISFSLSLVNPRSRYSEAGTVGGVAGLGSGDAASTSLCARLPPSVAANAPDPSPATPPLEEFPRIREGDRPDGEREIRKDRRKVVGRDSARLFTAGVTACESDRGAWTAPGPGRENSTSAPGILPLGARVALNELLDRSRGRRAEGGSGGAFAARDGGNRAHRDVLAASPTNPPSARRHRHPSHRPH